jgi:trimethylamine-N-oxide reductase cytochrome c-type subunit TorC
MKISDQLKGLVLAVVVSSLFLYGYRYYNYTQDDPDFCSTCHMVKEASRDWLNGKHRDVICQKCHQMGSVEQNLRLLSYVLTGRDPIAITHGRIKPWEECSSCHADTVSQGSVSPTKSYGHAKHVAVKRLQCKSCHAGSVHDFPPDDSSCQNCHPDKGVHGITLEEFSCLKCHSFSRKPLPLISKDACVKCHTDIPKKTHMSGLSCHYCHKPHKKRKPTSASCTVECHKSEATLGQHGFHVKQGIECMHCHRPHAWTVGRARTGTLCKECHQFKDPKTFRYIF